MIDVPCVPDRKTVKNRLHLALRADGKRQYAISESTSRSRSL